MTDDLILKPSEEFFNMILYNSDPNSQVYLRRSVFFYFLKNMIFYFLSKDTQ